MKKIVSVLTFTLFFFGCGVVQFLGKEEISHLRRPQQFTAIESGVPMEKYTLHVSGGYQCALEKPRLLEFKDTTLDLSGSTVTSTRSFTTSYKSLHALNLNIAYSLFKLFSFGLLFDMSFGKIFPDMAVNSVVRNNLYEGSIFFRFAINLNRFTLGVRPELMLSTNNYHSLIFDEWNFPFQDTEEWDKQIAFRNSLFARAKLFNETAVFLGFQLRTLPYSINNEKVEQDLHTGIYGGFSFYIADILFVDPYFALPFRAMLSRHRGPVQAGIRFTLEFAMKPE